MNEYYNIIIARSRHAAAAVKRWMHMTREIATDFKRKHNESNSIILVDRILLFTINNLQKEQNPTDGFDVVRMAYTNNRRKLTEK